MLPNTPDCRLENVYGKALDVAFTKRDTAVALLFRDAMFPGRALSDVRVRQALERQDRTNLERNSVRKW